MRIKCKDCNWEGDESDSCKINSIPGSCPVCGDFTYGLDKKEEDSVEKKKEEKEDFDLDGDGDVDIDDRKKAARFLGSKKGRGKKR